jgi:alkanesulfonate monooxygenase SsuD/methylene tetrahydromethanopterin reductase-like flavin-dependent oxidoreductase (luciferase family)
MIGFRVEPQRSRIGVAMPSLGVVFRPQLPPEHLRAAAEAAEAAGVEELWLWEDCFRESGIAAAAAALAWTSRLRVGIGLLPVPLRNVAITAMEVATLERMFPGRVDVGVGHGVQSWMAQVGARAESPLTLLREYVVALRALLAGEQVTTAGRYVRLDAVKLDWPPDRAPRVLAGVTGPRSLDLSGEFADGTILTASTTPDAVRAARERLSAAGAHPDHRLVVYLTAATGPGGAARVAAELRDEGASPDAELGVAGDAAAVAGAVRRWAEAGADAVVLQPTPDEPDLPSFTHFAAEEVEPLL